MVRYFPCALDFGQSNNMFHGISAFFKHNFCLAPRWKINWPRSRWTSFFLYFPAEIFGFSFNSWCKIGWPPGHLETVYCNDDCNDVILKSHDSIQEKKSLISFLKITSRNIAQMELFSVILNFFFLMQKSYY